MKKKLVCIAGLCGAIGTTLSLGLCASSDTDESTFGMATESDHLRSLKINFPSNESISIDGWDIKDENVYAAAKEKSICNNDFLSEAKNELENITPRKGFFPENYSINEWLIAETNYIKKVCEEKNIDQIFIINLLPTEPHSLQISDDSVSWEKPQNIEPNQKGITLSRIYFRLAIETGAHFINYTPNIAETPSLRELADNKSIVYCGRDGKTGQTFLKTLIAPAFRDKNLYIDGWFSTNILGNSDGSTLSDNDCCRTKAISKKECLSSILGYNPGGDKSEFGHQVHIHYYPPRGDAKEAWDNIDFIGFLGIKMQMKINWLGMDSVLAAPSIIDLIKIVDVAVQNGYEGLLEDVSYFFKNPLSNNNQPINHSLPDQYDQLIKFLKKLVAT